MILYENLKLIKKFFGKIYFSYDELKCKCGCRNFNGNEEFLKKLLLFRVIYDIPFTPRSVYRCKDHPDYSTNHDGHAVDVPYEKNNSNQRMKIVKAAIESGFKRIGISKDFIHIDNNPLYDKTINGEVLWIYPGISIDNNEK